MHFSLPDLLSRHAVASFDKQLHLSELVAEEDWHLDLVSGLLLFCDRFAWHAQLLGTEAEETHTWLWAWANETSHIPPYLLQTALQMKALGEHECAEPNSDRMFSQIKAVWIPASEKPVCRIVENFGGEWRDEVGRIGSRVAERWDRVGIGDGTPTYGEAVREEFSFGPAGPGID